VIALKTFKLTIPIHAAILGTFRKTIHNVKPLDRASRGKHKTLEEKLRRARASQKHAPIVPNIRA
jgi:hypothetical protein